MPKQRSTHSTIIKRSSRKDQKVLSECSTLGDGIRPTPASLTDYALTAKQLVLDAWPDIVQGLIKKAIGGGYQQTKILLDLCHFASKDASHLNEKEKQDLCDALLHGLRLSSVRVDETREKHSIDNNKNKRAAEQ